MKLSRRNFLGSASGAAITLWSFPPIAFHALGDSSERALDCILLDMGSHCALPESLQGYQATFAGQLHRLSEAKLDSLCSCRTVIVPGLGRMDPATAHTLSGLLETGTNILLESGAGFLSPTEFTAHQEILRRHFDIAIDPPVDLWSPKSAGDIPPAYRAGRHPKKKLDGPQSVPYVNYIWPSETTVRDFSSVIPVSAASGDIIGKVGVLPVALKKSTAGGTLIFLGSPLGPSLRASDPEALSWLRLVTAL